MLNITRRVYENNIRSACKRDLPWLSPEHCHFSGACAIIAGAPSIKDKIEEIRGLDIMTFSCNGTHDYLVEQGIAPDFFVMLDGRPCNDFAKAPQDDCVYFLASQCHPKVFDRFNEHKVVVWHTEHEWLPKKVIERCNRDHFGYVSAKGSVGLTAIGLAYTLGFTEFHLYGFDSSFDESQHPYQQPQNSHDEIIEHEVNGKIFKSTPTLSAQVWNFINTEKLLTELGCSIVMRSEGLIKEVYESQRDRKANH